MKTIAVAVPLFLLAAAGVAPALAQDIDCAKYVRGAQQAIDKVTDDMSGMEQRMEQDQLLQLHTLLADARMYLDGARQSCDRPKGDFDLARAIAKAEAARGSAEAADVLHFHMMKASPGMKGMTDSKGMGGMKGDAKGASDMKSDMKMKH